MGGRVFRWFRAIVEGLRRRPVLAELLTTFAAGAVVVAVWLPFLASHHINNGLSDWSYRADYMAYTLEAVRHDNQFPYWVTDPRFEQFRIKGVHDFFANPETEVLSIATPLSAAFDYLIAVKVEIVVYVLLGALGCRRLLRALGGRGSLPATALLAILAFGNGALVAHTLAGHTQFISSAVLPLALALLIEAWEPGRALALRTGLAGALFALSYYGGNAHLLIEFFVFSTVFGVGSVLLRPRMAPRALLAASATAAWFVGLAAFKLAPGMDDFGHYRANHLLTYDHWIDIGRALVTPWRVAPDAARHELNAYIGWAGVVVLAIALLGWNRRTAPLLAAVLVLCFMMLLKPGSHVLEWPVLRTQGVYTRMRIWVIFGLALAATTRIEGWIAWIRGRGRARLAAGAAVAVLVLDAYLALDFAKHNVADDVTLSCVHDLPKPEGPFLEAPRAAPADAAQATVQPAGLRTNAFRYRFRQADGAREALVVFPDLAARPAPHLRAIGPVVLAESDGHLAVRLEAKEGTFVLAFHDPVTVAALVATLLTLLALVLLALPRRAVRAVVAAARGVARRLTRRAAPAAAAAAQVEGTG